MPKVSVITPVYNRADYLIEAIKSIQQQSYTDWEQIIVDDGSANHGVQAVLNEVKGLPGITIYQIENRGLGGARNYGIERSNGEYILTLDDDDKWHRDFLGKAVSILDKSPQAGVVTSWMQNFGHLKGIIKPEGGDVKNFLIHNNSVHALFRKEAWEKSGRYEENKFFQSYTDWDLWLRITALGYNVDVIPELLFFYRTHKQSMSLDAGKIHMDLFRFLIEKNKGIYSKYLTETLLLFEEKLMTTRSMNSYGNLITKLKKKLSV